jgi:ribonuclease P protein component
MRKFFGSQFRLAQSRDFQHVFRRGRRYVKACLVVYVCPNSLEHSRLGAVVPKKVIALSTQRHRLKRIVRESFRLNQHRLAGYDVIVRVRSKPYTTALLWTTLEQVWHSIHP